MIINYFKICRNCLFSDFQELTFIHKPDNLNDYQRKMFIMYFYKTEYAASNFLQKQTTDCENCGQNNFDVYDIKVDGKEILDIDEITTEYDGYEEFYTGLHFFSLNNEGNIEFYNSKIKNESFEEYRSFELEAKHKILKIIGDIEENKFIQHNESLVDILFVGDQESIEIKKFRFYGVDKRLLVNILSKIRKENPFE